MRWAAFVAPCKCCKISTESKFQDNYVIMNHRLLEEQRSTSDTFIVPSPPPLTQNICTKFGRGGGLPPWVLSSLLCSCYWQIVDCTTQSALSVLIVTSLFSGIYYIRPLAWPSLQTFPSHPLLSPSMFNVYLLCFIQKCKCMMQSIFHPNSRHSSSL